MSFVKKLRQLYSSRDGIRDATPWTSRVAEQQAQAASTVPSQSSRADVRGQAQEWGLHQVKTGVEGTNTIHDDVQQLDVVVIPSIGASAPEMSLSLYQTHWLYQTPALPVSPCRVFYFHYPTDVFFGASLGGVSKFAEKLLDTLHKEEHRRSRPVILLCHGFGGILAKKAVCIAQDKFPASHHVIKGLVFLGTPHYASATSEPSAILGNIVNALHVGRIRADRFQAVHRNAAEFAAIAEAFAKQANSLYVISFYEELPTAPMNIIMVDRAAATLAPPHNSPIPLPVDHYEICQFAGPTLARYDAIRIAIQSMHSQIFSSSSFIRRSTANRSDADLYRFENHSNRVAMQGHMQIQTQNIFLGDAGSSHWRSSPDTYSEKSLSDTERRCLETICPIPLYGRHSNIESRTQGTLAWLADDAAYGAWLSSTSPHVLLITGYAGCGKSVLSSHITTSLSEMLAADSLVCKYFFDGTLRSQSSLCNLLRSFIHQIVMSRRKLLKIVRKRLERHPQLVTDFASLWALFEDLALHRRTQVLHLVIDAIDECDETEQCRIADHFRRLMSSNTALQIKLLVTSRPNSPATTRLGEAGALVMLLDQEDKRPLLKADVRIHICEHVGMLVRDGRCHESNRIILQEALEDKAEATFLWISLALSLLHRRRSLLKRSDIATQLGALPPDLAKMYEQLLVSIPEEEQELAERTLQMIRGSARHLTVRELNAMVSIGDSHQSLIEMRNDSCFADLRSVERLLEGLVRISDNRVVLVHHTLNEFLIERGQRKHNHHALIAESCMRYLLLEDLHFEAFNSLSPDSPTLLELGPNNEALSTASDNDSWMERLFKEPAEVTEDMARLVASRFELFEYAAKFWHFHFAQCAQNVPQELQESALRLCSAERQGSWYTYLTITGHEEYPRQPDAFTLACFFGHPSTLQKIGLQQSQPSLSLGVYWAARRGHTECVEMALSEINDTNYLLSDQRHYPLAAAAASGHLETLRLLLSKSIWPINHVGVDMRTPLSLAAAAAQCDVISEILKYDDADPNVPDTTGATALFWAVSAASPQAVRLLLADKRTNAAQLDKRRRSALSWSSEYGQAQIVQILATISQVKTDDKDVDGRTPLLHAVKSESLHVVKFLLRNGRVDVSQQDNDGRNAISWAAQLSSVEILELLLEKNQQYANVEDKYGWTPLAWTLDPPERVLNARALLRHVAKDLDDQRGLAIFSLAISWKAFEIAQMFVTSVLFDANTVSPAGRTALSYAAEAGHVKLVQQLLSTTSIDINLPDDKGNTPYLLAAAAGRVEVCELLSKRAEFEQTHMMSVGQ